MNESVSLTSRRLPFSAKDPVVSVRSSKPTPGRELIQVSGVQKSYRRGPFRVNVLRGVDMQVREGEFLAITGQSGSGKSTLLHLLAALDSADQGSIKWDGVLLDGLTGTARDRLRNRDFGIIFQFYHLLPELSTLENVMLSQLIAHGPLAYWSRRSAIRQRARDLLDQMGLTHREQHRPHELSGGEMQRAAIARALMAQPRILFADEPTGNLDRETGSAIMDLLRGLNATGGLTIVVVTHDPTIADQAHRRIRLVEGKVREG
jgi:lipoprotein-releasing system ATP-binding protein